VEVVTGMAGQDALGKQRRGQDEVLGPMSEQPQASATLFIDRCESFDATRVERSRPHRVDE
jgi:hypothetical protein